jgi:general stress protein CsbA
MSSIFEMYLHDNIKYQKMIFICANGPLALAVIILSNKLVYHSDDFIISSFIHTSPMLLSYINRWIVNKNLNESLSLLNYTEFIFLGLILYFVWVMPYYVTLYGILYKRTIEKNNETMFDYSIKNKLSFIINITSNRRLQQAIYSCIHLILVIITMMIAPIFWYNKFLHFCYIIFIVTISIWNGSSYYYYKMHNKKDDNDMKLRE